MPHFIPPDCQSLLRGMIEVEPEKRLSVSWGHADGGTVGDGDRIPRGVMKMGFQNLPISPWGYGWEGALWPSPTPGSGSRQAATPNWGGGNPPPHRGKAQAHTGPSVGGGSGTGCHCACGRCGAAGPVRLRRAAATRGRHEPHLALGGGGSPGTPPNTTPSTSLSAYCVQTTSLRLLYNPCPSQLEQIQKHPWYL